MLKDPELPVTCNVVGDWPVPYCHCCMVLGSVSRNNVPVSLGTQTTVVAKVISELKIFSKNGPLDTHR